MALTIALVIIVGLILMWIIPPDEYDSFDDEAIPYRTKGEWDKEDL